MHLTLAQYFYGFEGSVAAKVFMVGFGALALVAALLIRLTALQWIMAGMLFFTSLTAPANQDQTSYLQTWMLPVQMRRAEGHLALGVLMTLIVVLTGRIHMPRVPVQSVFLLGIGLYAGFMQFFHEGPIEAMQSIGFALAVIPCMCFAVPAACKTYEGCLQTIRAMMWVSVLWTVCSSIQFIINPRFVVNTQGRFWGMMANAQQAAMFNAPMAIIAIWLLLNDHKKRLKPLWVGLATINLLFVGWTASRSGAVMVVLGAAFVLYRRIGKVVLFLPVAALVFFALSFLSDELQIQSNIDRLTSVENTRASVWAAQIENIIESPLVGVGWHETGGSESSWLGGFAGYGVGMFLLMISLLLYSMWRCAWLWVRRSRLPKEQRPLVELFTAWNAMYFGVATFEGILVGRSSTTQVMTLMFAGIGVWVTEQAASRLTLTPDQDEASDPDAPPLIDGSVEETYGFDDGADDYPRRGRLA